MRGYTIVGGLQCAWLGSNYTLMQLPFDPTLHPELDPNVFWARNQEKRWGA